MDIELILKHLGFSQTKTGYKYIIEMANSLIMTGSFNYKTLANKHKTSEEHFRNEINNSIESAQACSEFKKINSYFNYEAYKEDTIITTSEFIYLLCRCVDINN